MAEIILLPNRQRLLAGLTVGIISIKPDDDDPEVLLGVYDPEQDKPVSFRLRPGDSATVAGRTLYVLAVQPNPDGSVTLACNDGVEDVGDQAAEGDEPQ